MKLQRVRNQGRENHFRGIVSPRKKTFFVSFQSILGALNWSPSTARCFGGPPAGIRVGHEDRSGSQSAQVGLGFLAGIYNKSGRSREHKNSLSSLLCEAEGERRTLTLKSKNYQIRKAGDDGGASSTGGEEDRRIRDPADPGGAHFTGGCRGATPSRAKAHDQHRTASSYAPSRVS